MRTILVVAAILLLLSCEKKNEIIEGKPVTACGTENVQENLPWLVEMIEKSENDKTGRYQCTIWLEKYKGDDIFVVCFPISSVFYHYFDCQGNLFIPDTPFIEIKKNIIVYCSLNSTTP